MNTSRRADTVPQIRRNRIGKSILLSLSSPSLLAEARAIAASTGREVIETLEKAEFERYMHGVWALLIDESMAHTIDVPLHRSRVFLVGEDPGPIAWEAARRIRAADAFLLPAEAPELLQAIGHVSSLSVPDTANACAPRVRSKDHHVDTSSLHIQRRSHPISRSEGDSSIAVVGAVGGSGASVFSSAVGLVSAQICTADVTLLDTEISGGSDLLLGLEEKPGARWCDLSLDSGHISAADIRAALPSRGRISIIAQKNSDYVEPDIAGIMNLLTKEQRDDRAKNLILLDASLEELTNIISFLHLVVVLVPAEVRAVRSALSVIESIRALRIEPVVVVVHRHWSGITSADIARITRAEVIGEFRFQKKVSRLIEENGIAGVLSGRPVFGSDLRRVCEDVLERVGL